jgi:peptidoglycan/LPS O-acetylase OafA/YrhL
MVAATPAVRFSARPSRTTQQLAYSPSIDGLRGIAVLAVLGFHAFPRSVPGGFVGVDVFFVISGFLITNIVVAQLHNSSFSFAAFYARRIRRLFPALALMLAASLGVGWLVLLPQEFEQLGRHAAAAAVFVANFAFWRESGYFDIAAHLKPLLHLWSLGIEEQFYLFWPLLLGAMWKRRMPAVRTLIVIVVASFACSVVLAGVAPVANFYLPFSRFWELGVGCLLALLKQDQSSVLKWFASTRLDAATARILRELMPLAGLALIIAAVFMVTAEMPFPSWPTLIPVIGALLVLGTPEDTYIQRRVLGHGALVWTGLISYALYLWHWPVLSFASILQAGPPTVAASTVGVIISFILAGLTFHFVEVPVRARKRVALSALIGAVAATGLAGLVVYVSAGVPARFDFDIQALRPGPRVDAHCKARLSGEDRFNYCRSTSPEPPDVLFLGDSRAQAVYEGAEPLLAPKYRVMLLARGGCHPLLGVRVHGYDPNEESCEEVWRAFVRYVHETKPRVVVLVGNGAELLYEPETELTRDTDQAEREEDVFAYGLSALVKELLSVSRVIYISEVPTFPSEPSCFLRTFRLPGQRCSPTIDRDTVRQTLSSYLAAVRNVAAMHPELITIDALDALCTPRVCSQRYGSGDVLYSDVVHLSSAGGRFLAQRSNLAHLIAQEAGATRNRLSVRE